MKVAVRWKWPTQRNKPEFPDEIEIPDELAELAQRCDIMITGPKPRDGYPKSQPGRRELSIHMDEPGGKMRAR